MVVAPPPTVRGSFVGSSSVYNLELLPSGRDYRRVVGLSERLGPHDVDRFQIRVYAPRSSVHRFRVHLRYGSHEASARETELRIYVPRSNEEPQLRSEADLAPA